MSTDDYESQIASRLQHIIFSIEQDDWETTKSGAQSLQTFLQLNKVDIPFDTELFNSTLNNVIDVADHSSSDRKSEKLEACLAPFRTPKRDGSCDDGWERSEGCCRKAIKKTIESMKNAGDDLLSTKGLTSEERELLGKDFLRNEDVEMIKRAKLDKSDVATYQTIVQNQVQTTIKQNEAYMNLSTSDKKNAVDPIPSLMNIPRTLFDKLCGNESRCNAIIKKFYTANGVTWVGWIGMLMTLRTITCIVFEVYRSSNEFTTWSTRLLAALGVIVGVLTGSWISIFVALLFFVIVITILGTGFANGIVNTTLNSGGRLIHSMYIFIDTWWNYLQTFALASLARTLYGIYQHWDEGVAEALCFEFSGFFNNESTSPLHMLISFLMHLACGVLSIFSTAIGTSCTEFVGIIQRASQMYSISTNVQGWMTALSKDSMVARDITFVGQTDNKLDSVGVPPEPFRVKLNSLDAVEAHAFAINTIVDVGAGDAFSTDEITAYVDSVIGLTQVTNNAASNALYALGSSLYDYVTGSTSDVKVTTSPPTGDVKVSSAFLGGASPTVVQAGQRFGQSTISPRQPLFGPTNMPFNGPTNMPSK